MNTPEDDLTPKCDTRRVPLDELVERAKACPVAFQSSI